MQTVNEYMKTHRLPTELRDNVRELYRLRFSDGKLLPPADVVLEELTPQLRSEINHYINTEMLCKVYFMIQPYPVPCPVPCPAPYRVPCPRALPRTLPYP